MIVTFCGHSNYTKTLDDETLLLNLLEKVIKNKNVDFFLGGYGNFDSFAFECAKKYKETHLNAKLIFVTPYLDERLNKEKDFLANIYDGIIYPELECIPKKIAILKRNEWMIKQADYVFAYVNTHYGGAYKTLLYAKKQGKPYTNLYHGNYELY